jgi:hypothetical protein
MRKHTIKQTWLREKKRRDALFNTSCNQNEILVDNSHFTAQLFTILFHFNPVPAKTFPKPNNPCASKRELCSIVLAPMDSRTLAVH